MSAKHLTLMSWKESRTFFFTHPELSKLPHHDRLIIKEHLAKMQNDKMELIQSFLQDHAKHSYETQDLLNKYNYENLGFAQQTSGFRIV